jgi:hypothetical protein
MNWLSIDEMPELIKAYEREGHYFGVVRKILDGVPEDYEFGVTEEGYRAFKKILDHRPFDNLPGLQYRYYFMNSIGHGGDPVSHHAQIMVIQGIDQRSFEFLVPQILMNNLQWFLDTKQPDRLKHLKKHK